MLCGEDWNDIMQDCMQLEDCFRVLRDIAVSVPDSSGNVQQVVSGTVVVRFSAI